MQEIALTCANATLRVDAEGILHLRWAPGSRVSSTDAAAVVTTVQDLTGAQLQPMLVEVVDVQMSPRARQTLVDKRFVSAVALVGATAVDRVMAAALLREQECPNRYFTSVDTARDWLSGLPVPSTMAESAV